MKIIRTALVLLVAVIGHFVYTSMVSAELPPKKIVLIGPPASGKGTQAQFLSQSLKLPSISTGDLLRQEVAKKTSVGSQIQESMAQGALVDDQVIGQLLQSRLAQPDCAKGFILDGFPRNIAQAKLLDNLGIEVNTVVEINVPDNEVKKRITGRRIHPGSGRTYHIDYNPPKVKGVDDVTSEPLVQREDDTLATLSKRLETYHTQTQPVVDYYLIRQAKGDLTYIEVNGALGIESIQNILMKRLK